ncbi:hypothetical protein M5K25_015756 [Dendrobium thyrsiflorum]|uniref:DYW domain-containing protein n=1 Tax=Dendrobium thyrsiflorum TaxID=117978 RepID=A0ABD0URS5_DENTH
MIRSGLVTHPLPASRLVAFCSSDDIGELDYARLVFGQIPKATTYTFNSIIHAYTNQDSPHQALSFYVDLIELGLVPDKFTLPSLFKCSQGLDDGRQLHCHAIKFGFGSDPYVQNTMMHMYSTCGCLTSAFEVFDKMTNKTVVSWATMIAALTKSDRSSEALGLYRRMRCENVEPNDITLLNVLAACASARDLETATQVVKHMKETGIRYSTMHSAALMDVYCKCGKVPLARKMFDDMPGRNLVCWNIMIKSYVENSEYRDALQLFRQMQLEGMKADKVTLASLVLACTHLGTLKLGKWLHAYTKREGIDVDVVLGTALVDMYAKCGCVENAVEIFDEMPHKNVMTWTALIRGFAMCGHGEKALQVFDEMRRSKVKPDSITFVGVLTACSHAGLVEEGRAHFGSMLSIYNIEPTVEHFGCMVDMFGRAGDLEKAVDLVRTMPMLPDNFVLGGLLAACRIHNNVEIAETTARQLLELDPDHAGTYVLLSNIYSSIGKREEAERVRSLMAERKVNKPPGCSMVEIDGEIHEFFMGDESHPRTAEIYEMLDNMMKRIGAAGYAAKSTEVMIEMEEEEEEKEKDLRRHSEKLAIAFGLISTRPGDSIRVMKNLRICADCHAAAKLVSAVYQREIVIRDRCRFHHFNGGSCSCNDFW